MSRLRKACFAVVALGLLLALANGIAWLVLWAPYGTHLVHGQPAGLYRDAAGHGRPQLLPGARLRGLLYSVSVNSQGFRGPGWATAKPKNGLRVWCVGGSTTFDIFAPDDSSTWPARTQQVLARALPGRTVEVMNAGIPGEVLSGSRLDFERLAPILRPDYLVIYHGPNDLRRVLFKGPPPVLGPPPLYEKLPLARALRPWLDGLQPLNHAPGRRFRLDQLESVMRQLAELADAARARNVRVVLATHAVRLKQRYTSQDAARQLHQDARLLALPPHDVARAFDAYNLRLTRLARRRKLPLADVRRVVPPDAHLWGDATHFKAGGSQLAGREVARAILRDLRGGAAGR